MKPSDYQPPKPKYRRDYTPPPFFVDRVDLRFDLDPAKTVVESKLRVRRAAGTSPDAPLALDGEALNLVSVVLDGEPLSPEAYTYENDVLTVPSVPAEFDLETRVEISPENNTELSGLYASGGILCTQCEAEGFRRITFHLDRPDVMASYRTTLVGDGERFPVMLSNGNRVDEGVDADGRTWVTWEDPFKKPSYLFALVAGHLSSVDGEFQTRSGRSVKLEIWVEPQNVDRCDHALRSLQRAMKWDEEVFGLEYDLDIYMVVAVSDFNMGAMENKGLNIFNAKYVLAQPETATDDDYEHVEGVIGHEYFHNWTGNRVTCRDWFQLTLKEGLTVFRDQLFTADMTSAAVKRISDVRLLRSVQFEEDSGPMAHPIRPDSYIAMDNFYTATVYVKGAEVVRMYHTLLGADGFRRGLDLYFERHDGQAVTCDDFLAAMADANHRDLSGLGIWYGQAGTPTITASGTYNPEEKTYALNLKQGPGKRADPSGYVARLMPIKVGLLGKDGRSLPLQLAGEAAPGPHERVLEFVSADQTFVFRGVEAAPVPSILRDFSAPVRLEMERSRADLAFSFAHDNDAFNRWDAGQSLAQEVLLDLVHGRTTEVDPAFVAAYGQMLSDESLDGSLKALAMALPAPRVLAQQVEQVDPDAIHEARERVLVELSSRYEDRLLRMYEGLAGPRAYVVDKVSIDGRRLKNAALGLLNAASSAHLALAEGQLMDADNMTDAQAALGVLTDHGGDAGRRAVDHFYRKWKDDPLVLDKWFAVQAVSKHPETLERVMELREHPDFTLDNPNRARSLIGALTMNLPRFHQRDGRGYVFLADQVEALHAKNPQIAARLVSALNGWRRFEPGRGRLMKAQLQRLSSLEGLSKDVFEIVQRALKD